MRRTPTSLYACHHPPAEWAEPSSRCGSQRPPACRAGSAAGPEFQPGGKGQGERDTLAVTGLLILCLCTWNTRLYRRNGPPDRACRATLRTQTGRVWGARKAFVVHWHLRVFSLGRFSPLTLLRVPVAWRISLSLPPPLQLGWTPLHLAALYGSVSVLHALLADPRVNPRETGYVRMPGQHRPAGSSSCCMSFLPVCSLAKRLWNVQRRSAGRPWMP